MGDVLSSRPMDGGFRREKAMDPITVGVALTVAFVGIQLGLIRWSCKS